MRCKLPIEKKKKESDANFEFKFNRSSMPPLELGILFRSTGSSCGKPSIPTNN